MDKLKRLGYGDWFRQQETDDKRAAHDIARVLTVHRDSYTVTKGDGDCFAECAGNLLYNAATPLDLPTTGDWVYTDFYDDDTHAVIHGVLPRKTVIKRKTAGRLVEFQLLAANIDVALIIQSVDENFNLRRLERYLVMVNEGNITPVILLSKCDLISEDKTEQLLKSIAPIAQQARVVPISTRSGKNIETVKSTLLPGRTYCLLGSSGVGKTTLLNTILGTEQFATQTVSTKGGKGRHTTTNRELVVLDSGALLIDTPGMRELGNMSVGTGIAETFSEISALAAQCRFTNCSHTGELGCAIAAALGIGELSEQRYRNYVKMKNESAFHDMSYFEKRKKDKAFGKMVKAVKKNKKRK